MKLEWSPWALKDRDAIFDFIEQDNPRAAIQIDNRIAEQIKRLVLFPESGRIGRCVGTRELVIDRTPYIAAYLIRDNRVRILRVLHEAQSWPEDLPTLGEQCHAKGPVGRRPGLGNLPKRLHAESPISAKLNPLRTHISSPQHSG